MNVMTRPVRQRAFVMQSLYILGFRRYGETLIKKLIGDTVRRCSTPIQYERFRCFLYRDAELCCHSPWVHRIVHSRDRPVSPLSFSLPLPPSPHPPSNGSTCPVLAGSTVTYLLGLYSCLLPKSRVINHRLTTGISLGPEAVNSKTHRNHECKIDSGFRRETLRDSDSQNLWWREARATLPRETRANTYLWPSNFISESAEY